jgi:hypothetical protein
MEITCGNCGTEMNIDAVPEHLYQAELKRNQDFVKLFQRLELIRHECSDPATSAALGSLADDFNILLDGMGWWDDLGGFEQ